MRQTLSFDALFVINQNCDLAGILHFCRDKSFRRFFILATHSLFDNERQALQSNSQHDIRVRTFADYLTDEEMASCDDQATRTLLPEYAQNESRANYNSKFMALSLAGKNRQVRDRLFSQERFEAIYCAAGLGVDANTWLSVGAVRLQPPIWSPPSRQRSWKKFSDGLRSLCKNKEFFLVSSGETGNFLFLSSLRRLRLTVNPERLVYRSIFEVVKNPLCFSSLSRVERYLRLQEERLGRKFVLATTIHEHSDWMSRLQRPLYIFVDGYHPANYPRTYYDSFCGDIAFVPRTMLDTCWFEQFGGRICRPPRFLEDELFREMQDVVPIKTVVLLLNHAGDWTALVNRSDTDRLVAAFVSAARVMPRAKFVIRPHPTMTDPSHEGQRSISRIMNYAAWCSLENLEVSTCSLAEDFQRGDLFVSEYSQTLLDAFRLGKAGLIVNVTGRRSFMADYETVGFPMMKEEENLAAALCRIISDPKAHAEAQNQSILRYNKLLSKYLAREGNG